MGINWVKGKLSDRYPGRIGILLNSKSGYRIIYLRPKLLLNSQIHNTTTSTVAQRPGIYLNVYEFDLFSANLKLVDKQTFTLMRCLHLSNESLKG